MSDYVRYCLYSPIWGYFEWIQESNANFMVILYVGIVSNFHKEIYPTLSDTILLGTIVRYISNRVYRPIFLSCRINCQKECIVHFDSRQFYKRKRLVRSCCLRYVATWQSTVIYKLYPVINSPFYCCANINDTIKQFSRRLKLTVCLFIADNGFKQFNLDV